MVDRLGREKECPERRTAPKKHGKPAAGKPRAAYGARSRWRGEDTNGSGAMRRAVGDPRSPLQTPLRRSRPRVRRLAPPRREPGIPPLLLVPRRALRGPTPAWGRGCLSSRRWRLSRGRTSGCCSSFVSGRDRGRCKRGEGSDLGPRREAMVCTTCIFRSHSRKKTQRLGVNVKEYTQRHICIWRL